jgi:hypothetical protein
VKRLPAREMPMVEATQRLKNPKNRLRFGEPSR